MHNRFTRAERVQLKVVKEIKWNIKLFNQPKRSQGKSNKEVDQRK